MSHDAAWVATLLASAADGESFRDGGRWYELDVPRPQTKPDVLTVTIYRPGVEEAVVKARVTVELIVDEEPDPTPDHQWQVTGWRPSEAQSVMDAWESAQELRN